MRGVSAGRRGIAAALAGGSAGRRSLALSIVAAVLAAPAAALAQDGSATNGRPANVKLPEIHVIGSTPLPPVPRPEKRAAAPRRSGEQRSRAATPPPAAAAPAVATPSGAAAEPGAVERDKIPANVQTLAAPDFAPDVAPTFLDALVRGTAGTTLSDQTGNEFQRDFDYRGFRASPVVGTPQGLAVYQNGVRINEVFGDTVNWDFLPQDAINQLTLVPSNPVYGLNAIGGALALEMKNGFTYHGAQTTVTGGSYGRVGTSVEAGGQQGNLSGYITADALDDAGWREVSPSRLRRLYADLGARGEDTEFHLTLTGADNYFGAVAATPLQMLQQNWASVYTYPQSTHNQLAFVTASASWRPTDTLTYQAVAYYRHFQQAHVDGNTTDAQNSGCPDPAVLCFPNLDGSLSNLITTTGATVPATGLLGTAVLGEIDRTWTNTNSFGGSVQAASSAKLFDRGNNAVVGMSIDRGLVQFSTTSELGTISGNPPFVEGTGLFIDQPSGDVAPVGLAAQTLYTGFYGTDTFDVTPRLAVTAGGRFNVAQIELEDTLGNDPGLDGSHTYARFNPSIGAAYKLTANLTLYAGYAEANRAPTPLELGCSDPLRPCLIDNALVGDPDLKQVVSHTVEFGLRGQEGLAGGALSWNAGAFHTENVDDIIDVASPIPGHEFFQNAGNTLRQGIEVAASYKRDRWTLYANYTYVDATFLNALTLASPNNPFAVNGNIFVTPGDHLPATPDHRFKAGAEYRITERWKVGADLNVVGSQYLVGDEANQLPKLPAYFVVNVSSSYQVAEKVELFAQVRNLFDQHFFTYGTLTDPGAIPYLNLTDPRTFIPGMPFAAYVGMRAAL
jgi:iron complex outermembrane recepter protein